MTTSLLYSILTVITIAQTPVDATAIVPAHLTPVIETSVDRNEILIGDVFELSIAITHDPAVQIVQRETGLELGQFQIKDIELPEKEILDDGKVRETIVYNLSTYFTGDFEIPAFEIFYQTDDGAKGSLKTSPIKITVRSLTPEESENLDIRDIKEPVVISGASRMWIIWTVVLSVFALIVLIYALWRYIKYRKAAIPEEPPLPAHEEAWLALQELRDDREWRENRDYEFFSTRVSGILRLYTGRRWRINALDETSEEILCELRSLQLDSDNCRKFEEFFLDCDLMKFAKHELPAEELDGLIDRAKLIVDLTFEQPLDEKDGDKDETKAGEKNESGPDAEPQDEQPVSEV